MLYVKSVQYLYIIMYQRLCRDGMIYTTFCRIENSCWLKEKIISDLATLTDGCDVIEEESDRLQVRLNEMTNRNTRLLQRVKKLACLAESRPPVLSEAEVCMMREMEGLRDNMKRMYSAILNVSQVFCKCVQWKQWTCEYNGHA